MNRNVLLKIRHPSKTYTTLCDIVLNSVHIVLMIRAGVADDLLFSGAFSVGDDLLFSADLLLDFTKSHARAFLAESHSLPFHCGCRARV